MTSAPWESGFAALTTDTTDLEFADSVTVYFSMLYKSLQKVLGTC